MTRCLLVTGIFPPHIGGPATFIELIARALAGQGLLVTVVCSSERPNDPSDRERPYRVRRICAASPVGYHLTVRRVLLTEVARHRSILVNGLERFVYPIARALRRPYVLKVVGDEAWETARNTGRTALDIDQFQTDLAAQSEFRAMIEARNHRVRYASHVFTPSEYARTMVVGWGTPAGRVSTIRNGVEVRPGACRGPARRGREPLEVIFVGRLTNWKGVETLLLAVGTLDEIHVTIAGDGPQLPHLVELARQLKLGSRVEFLGRLPRVEVQARMARSHVLVLTSLYEGLSHTLLEAMAAGLPCVASNRGGNREVITSDDDGILVPAQDVVALQGALRRLRDDEADRLRMTEAARRKSAQFPLGATVSAVTELLRAVHP